MVRHAKFGRAAPRAGNPHVTLLSLVLLAMAAQGVPVEPSASQPLVKGFNGAISPDGATLAFQRDAGAETWLGLYDLRTGATTWVEKGPGRAAFPCWTRTGDLLYAHGNELHTAFETWKGNLKEGYGIRLRGKDGTTRDVLVRGRWRDYSPCLSPDGHTLWFVTSRPPPGHPRAGDFIGSCLARADLQGQGGASASAGEIVHYPSENWGTGVSQPVVSPDGKLIAWAELTTFALPWRIMAARADDLAHPVSLTPTDMAAYAPNWSPDGTLLTFTGCRGDDPGWHVYVLDPALNRLRRVCPGENSSFAPDGKSLVYDCDGTVYLRPFGAADRPTASDPLSKPADAFPWKEAEMVLYAGTNFTRTAQAPLPATCAFGDEQTFFVRAKVDWDGDASRFQIMTFGRYAEHPLGFQLYFALNGRPHVGTRDANGRHVCLHTREPLAKAGVYEITGIRSKGRLWLCVGGTEPICAEFGDGLIALDHPQNMAIGSGLLPKSRLLSLEVGRGWPANVPVPRGGGLNDWRSLQ